MCEVAVYAGVGGTQGCTGCPIGDGGDATSARLNNAHGSVWMDTTKMLFIADDLQNRIRRVNPDTKIINTIAGSIFYDYFCYQLIYNCFLR
jgi:hypothetical protein